MADFEEWLAAQPEAAQALFAEHVAGLKAALAAERMARKEYKKLKALKAVRSSEDCAEAASQRLEEQESEEAVMQIMGDVHPLVERAVRKDHTVPVKIIQPGWGTSGHYSKDVLERDGPNVFRKGLKMYWDHPTQREAAERPERSLRDLAGELVSDAAWREDGPAGAGLYADAKVFEHFRSAVDDLAPHIGVSIRARGTVKPGEADGREGNLVTAITDAASVDFVTVPGAGGKVLELFEAARPASDGAARPVAEAETEAEAVAEEPVAAETAETEPVATEVEPEVVVPAEETPPEEPPAQEEAQQTVIQAATSELIEASLNEKIDGLTKALQEAHARLASHEAAGIVARVIEECGRELPTAAKARVSQRFAEGLPVTPEGGLAGETLAASVTEAVRAEIAYLAEITGSGSIRGMGGGTPPDGKAAMRESFVSLFLAQGKTKEEAERLAETASKGR